MSFSAFLRCAAVASAGHLHEVLPAGKSEPSSRDGRLRFDSGTAFSAPSERKAHGLVLEIDGSHRAPR